jgi:uncharacterized protein YjbI with pentapeptide repeats
MPNDEHVAMLARGAAAWNGWRADHDETPDLSRVGLRGLDLSGFDLSRADLRDADLRGTNLSGANLSVAHLDGANFFKAVLDGADLAGAFLNGAQFRQGPLPACAMAEAKCVGAGPAHDAGGYSPMTRAL